ncbi:MAG: MFS transporter [Candidatus Bathyarchaeia archaeon]
MKDESNNQNDGKWLNRNVAAMGFTSLFSDASHEMATAALPSFITELVGAASAPQILGLITGLSDASSSFVKTFSGWLSDRLRRRKPLVVLGYLLTGLFVGIIGFARSWVEIFVYRVLAWMGRGTREPPRDALLADSVDKRFYGHAFGFHRAMDTLGAILGPLLAFLLISWLGLRNVFFLSLIPGSLAVLVIAIGVKESIRKPEAKRGFFWHMKSLPKDFRVFVFIMFVFGIANFNRTLLLLRVQEVLTPLSGVIIAVSASILLYMVRNIAQALADYGIGSLSDKLGRKSLLAFFGFLLFGITSLGFVYATDIYFFIFLFVLSGISAATYTALEKAYAADLLPSNIRGTGYGVLQTIDGIGDFISSFVVGTIWALVSPELSFVYAALLSFASALLLLGLMKR